MIDSPAEIVRSYRMAADPKKQIKVLAELNACSVKEIRQVLVGEGVLPRETEVPEEPKKAARKRFDEETARMLYEEGLDDAAIAKATGMTAHTVAKWRSRNGLRKKARKPRMKSKWMCRARSRRKRNRTCRRSPSSGRRSRLRSRTLQRALRRSRGR